MSKLKISKRKSVIDKDTTIATVSKEKTLSEMIFNKEDNNTIKEGTYKIHERTSLLDKDTKIVTVTREKPLQETLFGTEEEIRRGMKEDREKYRREKENDKRRIGELSQKIFDEMANYNVSTGNKINQNRKISSNDYGTFYNANEIAKFIPSEKYTEKESNEYAKYVSNCLLDKNIELEDIIESKKIKINERYGLFGLLKRSSEYTGNKVISKGIKLFDIYDTDEYDNGEILQRETHVITYLSFDGKIIYHKYRDSIAKGGKHNIYDAENTNGKSNDIVKVWEKNLNFDNIALIDYTLNKLGIDISYDNFIKSKNKEILNKNKIDKIRVDIENKNNITETKYVGKISILMQSAMLLILLLMIVSTWQLRIIYTIAIGAFIYFKKEVVFSYDELAMLLLSLGSAIIELFFVITINKSIMWQDIVSMILLLSIMTIAVIMLIQEIKRRKIK